MPPSACLVAFRGLYRGVFLELSQPPTDYREPASCHAENNSWGTTNSITSAPPLTAALERSLEVSSDASALTFWTCRQHHLRGRHAPRVTYQEATPMINSPTWFTSTSKSTACLFPDMGNKQTTEPSWRLSAALKLVTLRCHLPLCHRGAEGGYQLPCSSSSSYHQ